MGRGGGWCEGKRGIGWLELGVGVNSCLAKGVRMRGFGVSGDDQDEYAKEVFALLLFVNRHARPM